MVDYGIARAKYLDAPIYRTLSRPPARKLAEMGTLVDAIKWSEVSKRFAAAK